MTQTGNLDVDFTSPGFKQATNTGLMNMFKETIPARFDIKYPKAFTSVPMVLLSITGLHIAGEAHANFTVCPIDITSSAFKIELTPRIQNSASGVTISWLATDA